MIGRTKLLLFIIILATAEGQPQDLEQECNILKTLDSLHSRVEEQDVRLREQELNLREQTIIVRELETRLSEKDANINRLDARLDQKDTQISQLEARLDEKDTQISRLNTDFDEKDTHISRLDARLEQKDTQISQLEARLDEKDTQIRRLEIKLSEKETRIGDLETLVGEQKAEIASLKQRLASVHPVGFSVNIPTESPSGSDRVTFSQRFTNAGDGYDTRTGVFSCPLAGTYFFSVTLLKKFDYTGSAIACSIFKNNVRLVRAYFGQAHSPSAGWQFSAVNSVYVRLSVGDTITLRQCKDIADALNGESSFAGFLVTPDHV